MRLNHKGVQLLDEALAGIGAKKAAAQQDSQTAQDRYFAMLLGAMPESQRLATITSNPNWRSKGSVDIPAYQKTKQEELDDLALSDSISNFPNLAPEIRNAGTYQRAYKAAEPKEVMETDIQRQTLSPEDFQKAVRISGGVEMKPVEVAQTKETTRHHKVDEGQLAPVRSTQAGYNTARIVKTGAETRGVISKNQLVGGGAAAPVKDNPIVQGLVTRTYDPALMRRFKPEEQAALFGAAQAIDPTVNLSDYQVQFGVKKDFNTGKSAQAVRSINQLVGHLNQLNKLKTQLNNTNVLPGLVNPISNLVAGQTSPTFQKSAGEYEQTAHAVGNELETMLRGSSQSGQKEREDVMKRLGVNKSPAAIDGAISAALNLMASRANELRDQYQKGVGRPADFTMLNPESEKVLRNLGADPQIIDALAARTAPNPQMPGVASAPIVQQSKSTGAFRYSTDGGKTWRPGKP